jgi:MFS transporter, DHA1 family, multidrug resistance protein
MILALIIMPETNPYVLLQRRAKKIRKETGENQWHTKTNIKESPTRLLLLSLYRPMKVLPFSFCISHF